MKNEVALIRYEAARNALAEARSVDEVLDVRDRAKRIHYYARQAKDREMIDAATELRLRAERRLGEMIAEQKETVGLNRGAAAGGKKHSPRGSFAEPRDTRPTLAEAGIDKKLSARSQQLAALPDDQFALRLSAAKREAVEHIEMPFAARAAEKKERRAEREAELATKITALPTKKYGLILADPPWRFKTFTETGLTNSSADNHYPTLSLEQIQALDVLSIAADDCVMFLWATVPHLANALDIMRGPWGFAYKSNLAWIKNRSGTGYWFRNKHEHLLVATRGDIPVPAPGTQFDSAVEASVGRHSEKPAIVHKMIEAYYPNLPKIELFARAARPGWDAWGNEAPVTLEMECAS